MSTSKLLVFEKLHNIRDLGGMRACDGRRIVSGKLVRCGDLSEFSDKMQAIQIAGENYTSFGGANADEDSSVKFIIKTDSIKSL